MNMKLTEKQISILHNCLLDLRDSSSLKNPSFLPVALDRLVNSEGFGIEMSGIYLSIDDDFENVPDYLKDGMAFEFMDDHVVLSFSDGTSFITNWCKKNVTQDYEKILLKCSSLEKRFQEKE
ncbi:hypothetical protein ACQKQA_04275 [Pseudomonas sp. NPDC089530]|uniref:hypothetical protein n=1 Tax=Pseudomonas sp. NPDC089530 TaxID=3390651 RepID=UPI003D05B2B9